MRGCASRRWGPERRISSRAWPMPSSTAPHSWRSRPRRTCRGCTGNPISSWTSCSCLPRSQSGMPGLKARTRFRKSYGRRSSWPRRRSRARPTSNCPKTSRTKKRMRPRDRCPSSASRTLRRIEHIDSLPAEISVHYVPEVEVVGEIRTSLHVLREQVRKPREAAWADRSRERVLKRLESELGERSKGVLKHQRILWELRDLLGPDDLLISDVGAHKLWLGRFFRTMKPNTVIISNGLSAMGIALPGGIAAKLADPNPRAVTLSGDGGFLMSVHELETAKREQAATVNPVVHDGLLGNIRWK